MAAAHCVSQMAASFPAERLLGFVSLQTRWNLEVDVAAACCRVGLMESGSGHVGGPVSITVSIA